MPSPIKHVRISRTTSEYCSSLNFSLRRESVLRNIHLLCTISVLYTCNNASWMTARMNLCRCFSQFVTNHYMYALLHRTVTRERTVTVFNWLQRSNFFILSTFETCMTFLDYFFHTHVHNAYLAHIAVYLSIPSQNI